jgi:ElaB/YqjD/DUF883 family membrane-anchored ribosome-binding protein
MVTPKHLATFLLGAAAGAALMKYNSMTDEEKEKLISDLKSKAETVKNEAEEGLGKFRDYFDELKSKSEEAMKDHLANTENFMNDLFNKKKDDTQTV